MRGTGNNRIKNEQHSEKEDKKNKEEIAETVEIRS